MIYGFRGGVNQTPVSCEIRKMITAFRFVSTYKFISCERSAHACLQYCAFLFRHSLR